MIVSLRNGVPRTEEQEEVDRKLDRLAASPPDDTDGKEQKAPSTKADDDEDKSRP